MLRRYCETRVKFYPQIQIGQKTQFLNALEPHTEKDDPISDLVEDIPELRRKLDFRLWNSLANRDWERWEGVADLYSQHSLPMDEVSYTLMCHGYLMSHHDPCSVALLVLDRMKHEKVHPAVVKLNENLLNSFFELSELGVKSRSNSWINVARLAWMSAARLRKKRMDRVREHLEKLPTEDVLKLSSGDVTSLIDSEHALAHVMAKDADLLQ